MFTKIKATDQRIFDMISSLPHPFIGRFMATTVHILTWGGLIYYPFIIYYGTAGGLRTMAQEWFFALAITYIINDLFFKNLIKRPRPFKHDRGVKALPFPPLSYSFPSGQTAAAAASGTILFLAYPTPAFQIGLILFVLLVGFDRIYTRHHYPTDVLGGIISGTLTALIVSALF